MQLIRRDRLVLSGSDPRVDDVTMPILLKALQHAAEATQKTALRLTGCDWWGRGAGGGGGSSPPEETAETASDLARRAAPLDLSVMAWQGSHRVRLNPIRCREVP